MEEMSKRNNQDPSDIQKPAYANIGRKAIEAQGEKQKNFGEIINSEKIACMEVYPFSFFNNLLAPMLAKVT